MLSFNASSIEELIKICQKDQAKCNSIKQSLSLIDDSSKSEIKECSNFLFQLNYDFQKIISTLENLVSNLNSSQHTLDNSVLRIEELETKLKNRETDIFTLERMINSNEQIISELKNLNNKNQNYIEELLIKLKLSKQSVAESTCASAQNTKSNFYPVYEYKDTMNNSNNLNDSKNLRSAKKTNNICNCFKPIKNNTLSYQYCSGNELTNENNSDRRIASSQKTLVPKSDLFYDYSKPKNENLDGYISDDIGINLRNSSNNYKNKPYRTNKALSVDISSNENDLENPQRLRSRKNLKNKYNLMCSPDYIRKDEDDIINKLHYNYGAYMGEEKKDKQNMTEPVICSLVKKPMNNIYNNNQNINNDYFNKKNNLTYEQNYYNHPLQVDQIGNNLNNNNNQLIINKPENLYTKSEIQTKEPELKNYTNDYLDKRKLQYDYQSLPLSYKERFENPKDEQKKEIEEKKEIDGMNKNKDLRMNNLDQENDEKEKNNLLRSKKNKTPISKNEIENQCFEPNQNPTDIQISKDKINRIQNIVMAAFQDEETINILKQKLGNDFEEKLTKGDVTEEYLDAIEAVLNELKKDKNLKENEKEDPKIMQEKYEKEEPKIMEEKYEPKIDEYRTVNNLKCIGKKKEKTKPKFIYRSLAQKRDLERMVNDKRYNYIEYPRGWNSTKEYFMNNGTSEGKMEKSPLKIN